MKKLVLIDSNALVHRAFHALPPSLASQKGVMTNAVFGFTSVLLKMLKDINPDYAVSTFDLAGKTFRHEEFEDYKIHRQKAPDELYAQIPLIKNVLSGFGIPIFELQGFEADDLIGALSEQAKKEKNLQVIIITGDLDTLQLVDDDKVIVSTLRKGITDTVIYDQKEVKKRYGIKPDQVIDFKGLKGDPSDNIPGVPGVGDKTASALISEFGSIEKMYEVLESDKGGKKKKKTSVSDKLKERLIANKDMAFFSKKLATIRKDVPIKLDLSHADWRTHFNSEKLSSLFKEFGFFSLSKRLGELFSSGMTNQTIDFESTPKNSGENLSQDIPSDLAYLKEKGEFVFDIVGNIFMATADGEKVIEIDIENLEKSKDKNLWSIFCSLLESETIRKSGYDLKVVVKRFMDKGLDVNGLYGDIKIMAWLLNPDMKDYGLERIYASEFQQDIRSESNSRLADMKSLAEHLLEHIKGRKLWTVLSEIEMPLVSVIAKMELIGIKIDTSSLESLSALVNKELIGLEQKIHKEAGINFNINSPAQLSEVLFNKLGLKGKIKKTSKGAISTAAGELEKLIDSHPIIEMILRYREIQKIKTTYIEPFPKLIRKDTGRVHTTYNQVGAATGRLSSQDPNLQNIPIRTELGQEFRRSFVSKPGFKFLSFDYTQLELRIAAHMAQDTKMIAAFKKREDIHTRTAAEIFNVEPKSVTANMRRQAKALNFGLLYGMGVLGFQRASGVDREKAREFIAAYMEEFSGIAAYMERVKKEARQNGYVQTIFGRKRLLPELRSGIPQLVAQAERIAINMPIQGTGADFMKIAMIRADQYIRKECKNNEVRLLLQVHDELVFEVKNNLVEKINKDITAIMEGVYKLDVPLTVESKAGDNWRDMELI